MDFFGKEHVKYCQDNSLFCTCTIHRSLKGKPMTPNKPDSNKPKKENDMNNYIQEVQNALDGELKMRGTPYEGLLEVYGLLVFTVGVNCTKKHIHDAWSIWRLDLSHK